MLFQCFFDFAYIGHSDCCVFVIFDVVLHFYAVVPDDERVLAPSFLEGLFLDSVLDTSGDLFDRVVGCRSGDFSSCS
jgi:hypothetical protein